MRNEKSVQTVPATAVAAYSLLQLAGVHVYGPDGIPQDLPDPAWMRGRRPRLCPTQRLISQLRLEAWGEQIPQSSFGGFTMAPYKHRPHAGADEKLQKPLSPIDSAAFYARNA